MLLCSTITETLQSADFCEEIVMSPAPADLSDERCLRRSAGQSHDLPGD
jgi:hypothetical protein